MRVNCLACNHSFELNAEQLAAAAAEAEAAADPLAGVRDYGLRPEETPAPQYTRAELDALPPDEFLGYAARYGLGVPADDLNDGVRRHVSQVLEQRGGVKPDGSAPASAGGADTAAAGAGAEAPAAGAGAVDAETDPPPAG